MSSTSVSSTQTTAATFAGGSGGGAARLPSREAAAAYLRKPSAAAALDLVVTELLSAQPEDPERHLLEFLARRYQQQHSGAGFSNITMFVSEGDAISGQNHHNGAGGGSSNRHPVPPMTRTQSNTSAASGPRSSTNSMRRSSVGGANNNNAGSGGNNGNGAEAPAEELLQWVLDCCLPGSDAALSRRERVQLASSGVPAGAETHHLAFRARQLVTRYTATDMNNSSGSGSVGRTIMDESITSPPEDPLAGGTKDTGLAHGANTSSAITVFSSASNNTKAGGSSNDAAAGAAAVAAASSSSSPSPSKEAGIFTPTAMSHLKHTFNLSESDNKNVLLAVSDAMQIILDWAGDPLLVAENLAGVVKLLVKGERCTVFVADERNQTLRTVIEGKHITVPFGQGIVGRCAAQKAPLLVNNAYSHPSFNPTVDSEVNYVTRNILSMPMMVEGHLIAVVQVLNKGDGERFTDVDVQVFKAFTAVAGIVVRDAMTFPLVLRNCELAEASKDLCTTLLQVNMLSEKDACAGWAAQLRAFLSADCCTVLKVRCSGELLDASPQHLEMSFMGADSEVDFGGFQPLPQRQLIAAALASRNAELVNNARNDPRFDQASAARVINGVRYETSSALLVPVFPFSDAEVSLSTTGQSNYFFAFQFENFRETEVAPQEAAANSTGNNNNGGGARGGGGTLTRGLSGSGNGRSAFEQKLNSSNSSSYDIIFSEEAVVHVQRILPFLERLLRNMCLVAAQAVQTSLLREVAKTVSLLCEERLEFVDMFDAISRTVEAMIQRHELRRGSVLFYAKVDSESVDQLQLLPRASIAAGASMRHHHGGGGGEGGGGLQHVGSSASLTGGSGGGVRAPLTPGGSGGGRPAPSFRMRRRGSLANLNADLTSQRVTDVKIPIGSGVVGNAVARSAHATYYTAEEVNALYTDGEFGGLVEVGHLPNCPALVVPLSDNRLLLGALVILRPRDEIRERLINDATKDLAIAAATSAASAGNNAGSFLNPIALDQIDWRTATPSRLTQVARVDFLAALIAVSKYVLKASNTITALARQQEGLLFSGELERLAMPTSNNSASGNNGSGSQETDNADGGRSPSRVLSAANISQFTFGGKATASPLEKPLRPEMFDMLLSTAFPIFEFVDGNQPATGLVPLAVSMFRSLACLEPLGIDEGALSATLLKAFRRYRDVPYHNVFHAFDVTQSVYAFMRMARLDEALLPAERFAMLLSAVFHDIDHNGLNNAYHMKAETAFGMIASMSGQKSVLEYHHCQVAIDLINSMTLLKRVSEEERRRILKIFFSCILATDMAVHREIMQQIQTQFLGEDGVTRTFEPGNIEHRDLAMKMLLKMADISNPVKDFALARRWALSVTEEFYRQGDVERSDGFEVAPMMDRRLNAELSKGQIGFITFMASPFFTLAAKCFEPFEELSRNMANNLARWQKVQASAEESSSSAVGAAKQ